MQGIVNGLRGLHRFTPPPGVDETPEYRELMKKRTLVSEHPIVRVHTETGELILREGDDLGPDFVLEPVAERRLHLLTLSRISRVKEIRLPGGTIAAPDAVRTGVPLSAEQMKRARLQFLENYLKHLP